MRDFARASELVVAAIDTIIALCGTAGFATSHPIPNRATPAMRDAPLAIVRPRMDGHPSPRRLSEASVYRLLKARGLVTSPAFIVIKAADKFTNPTTAINQLWQTDFTYLKVTGWGWFYLSTVLDDFSRYIVAWKLCTTMRADDVTDTLDLALQASGLDDAPPERRPRLLSDNGPSYVASDLSSWLEGQGMKHTRGKPYHPMTQGKIERWHLSLKSRILLENYYLPGDLERAVADFVEHYNHRRYHESLDNLTPANVYFGRGPRILQRREEIKRKTIEQRRRLHLQNRNLKTKSMGPMLS